MKIHNLKIWPEYYDPLRSGRKTFEIRFNDRDFKVGDQVVLHEVSRLDDIYTGRLILAEITYIYEDNDKEFVMPGFCILALKLLKESITTSNTPNTGYQWGVT